MLRGSRVFSALRGLGGQSRSQPEKKVDDLCPENYVSKVCYSFAEISNRSRRNGRIIRELRTLEIKNLNKISGQS